MISSPVDRIATRGCATTETRAIPIAASTPVSREVSTSRARSTVSPCATSGPAKLMLRPGVSAFVTTSASPSIEVCSTIRTASAPRGMTPPVGIAIALPGPTVALGTAPIATRAPSPGQPQLPGREPAGAEGVARPDCEPVDVRAIEAGYVGRADDVLGEDPPERLVERDDLGAPRRDITKRCAERSLGLVAIDDVEKLFLLHRDSSS